MRVFVDTSALYALMDGSDQHHTQAKRLWEYIFQSGIRPITSNYVLVETTALVQHRLGLEALRSMVLGIEPELQIEWVTSADHDASVKWLLAASRRKLSLVDCSSFHLMTRLGLSIAFTFDAHFFEQGFEPLVPLPSR